MLQIGKHVAAECHDRAMTQNGKKAQNLRPLGRRTEITVALCAITITGLALITLPWWVGYSIDGSTDAARLRLDTLRTALGFTAGLVGGIALWLAIRKQRSTELDLQQKERIGENASHDATERRITEQYVHASNQLASDRVAVQLAGVYAFERLAQDNPRLRQVIVDLLCAYLRMSTKDRTVSPYRTRNPSGYTYNSLGHSLRANALVTQPSGTAERKNAGLPSREVQSAIRDILIKHTRWYVAPVPSFKPPEVADGADFWPNTEINLSDSILESWNLQGCRFQRIKFNGATFRGETNVSYVECDHNAEFEKCIFEGLTTFYRMKIGGNLRLQDARLKDEAHFESVECDGWADFSWAQFSYLSWFEWSRFKYVNFDGTEFDRETWFHKAHFENPVDFSKAIFKVSARFEGATFGGTYFGGDLGHLRSASEKNPGAKISLP